MAIMSPEWLPAVREAWMNEEDVDYDQVSFLDFSQTVCQNHSLTSFLQPCHLARSRLSHDASRGCRLFSDAFRKG